MNNNFLSDSNALFSKYVSSTPWIHVMTGIFNSFAAITATGEVSVLFITISIPVSKNILLWYLFVSILLKIIKVFSFC